MTIDLETHFAASGDAAGDTWTSIENLDGSRGADSFTGDAGDNYINGGAGADALDGGGGFDGVLYYNSPGAVTVNLTADTATGGDATGDTLSNFDGVFGSPFDDVLTGTSGPNSLYGGYGGNDRLRGLGGADTLVGDLGNDILLP
ncbi:MAG: hypothetical protein M3290_07715, partial [Actinomycetota bacterium]|nr:hypothetical protein [Actinomycetota bacterium]